MVSKFFDLFRPRVRWPKLLSKTERPPSPREQFGVVFDVVQLSHTFADSKSFVDMIPRMKPRTILKHYHRQYGTQLDITRFVRDHFIAPPALPEPEAPAENESSALKVREHIDRMWEVLTREADRPNKYSSLLGLPNNYIVPGGRFREIYYWDSYFTMLGLRESGKDELIEQMVRNFAYLISRFGFIPNGNRTYYLSRSQPPVFAHMVALLAEIRGEHIFDEFKPFVVQEYKYWMRGGERASFVKGDSEAAEHVVRMQDGEIMNRYWDSSISPREESFAEDVEIGRHIDESANFYRNMRTGAESGWDFSSRWFADGGGRSSIRITDLVPVDLNIFLFQTEELLSRMYQREGKFKLSARYDTLASSRRTAIQKYLWDEESGWFTDYVHSEKRRVAKPTLASVFPLFGGIATTEQATRVIEMIEEKFLRPGGVVTTLETTGEQWDAPNGWAPLIYITVMALERYGAQELAHEIALRWCSLNISVYEKTGLLLEKYNVEDVESLAAGGEYAVQDGFGWTNGVLLALMNKYHIYKEVPSDVTVPIIDEVRAPAEKSSSPI